MGAFPNHIYVVFYFEFSKYFEILIMLTKNFRNISRIYVDIYIILDKRNL